MTLATDLAALQTGSVALKRAGDPAALSRVAGLEFGLTAPNSAWPMLTVRGGVQGDGGTLISSSARPEGASTDAQRNATITTSPLGAISIPGDSAGTPTETSNWSFVKLSYSGEFDLTLSRLTAAALLETSKTTVRLCGGTIRSRTVTGGTSVSDPVDALSLPKYVAWHTSGGYQAGTIASAPSLAGMDQPWLLLFWGNQSHWCDTTKPLNYSQNINQGFVTLPGRYAYQADCPLLLVFSANPTAIVQAGGAGGCDLTLPAGAKKVSIFPLYGRLRQNAAITNGWNNGTNLAAGAKTLIAAWYPRLQQFPASVAETYAWASDTATITETVTWTTVLASGATKFCPLPPFLGVARDTSLSGLAVPSAVVSGGVIPLAFDGDSLTWGQNASSGIGTALTTATNYPGRVMNVLGTGSYSGTNLGHPGDDIPTIAARSAATDAVWSGTARTSLCLIWAGYNDLASAFTPANIYASLVSYWQARRARGFKVIAFTVLPGASGYGSFEANRLTLNALIRAGWATYCDALVDLTTNSNIGPPGANTNTTYFNADGIHLTDAGYQIVATMALAQIATVVAMPSVVSDGGVPTGYGPSQGVVGVDAYSWTLAGLAPYTVARPAPGSGGIPATLQTEINAQVDALLTKAHWSPWYCADRMPQYQPGGNVYFANPADTLALASEMVPLVSGSRKTSLIAWLVAERAAFNPETVYSVTVNTSTDGNRGPASLPNTHGPSYFGQSHTSSYQSRQWLWACWGLSRFYQETAASLAGLTIATNLYPTLLADMAEQDWATSSWFVHGTATQTNGVPYPLVGDRMTAVENANRHWAGLAGLAWLMLQKSDANEAIVRALLAKATVTRVAMAHLPRWQAAQGLITIPTDLGSTAANNAWVATFATGQQGSVFTFSWATSADDPRQVVFLDQFQAHLDDSNARHGWNIGEEYAYAPPYVNLVKPLADLLTAAVGAELTIYLNKYEELQPHWWLPFAQGVLGQEHGLSHPSDSFGFLCVDAWARGTAPATLQRRAGFSWLTP